ncbi:hypothetical protein Goklo_027177 [Gossypium klotzschianum]|uniref:hAT-like transposase RNase-H fold domain-containing protein n=1 Tax=Gossypium klotzschianum TaxID=34286 RepID=A0A7J8TXG4_9ROSI|nr:hypothetical protein [Gossypium klotzschianum]
MKISNARDTIHERPTSEEAKCLDDIEVATYMRRNRKKTSIVWQELIVVKLVDGTKKVQCNKCKIKLAKNKDDTTTQYKRHLNGCVKRHVSLKGQGNLFLPPQAPAFDNASGVLNFVDVPPPHSGVVVYDALYKCLQDCSIEGKVCSISMENAFYNDAVVTMSKDSLSFHKKLPLNGKLFHVRCCAHILSLLVHDGHSKIEDVIDNVRESVKHIKASTVHLTMFSDIVKQIQLPNKRLILDCCTRWNATYVMLSCVLEFKDVFRRYAQRDASYKYLLSDEDWVRVEESIKELLMEKSLSEELCMRQMADKMQRKFDKYWGEFNLLIYITAILDPKNKMELIDFKYVDEYTLVNVGTSMENDVQESGVNNASTTSRIGKGKVIVGRSKFERYIRSVDTVDNVKSELDIYLEEGAFICKENCGDFNALEW